jgi:DNA-binding transcriptional regulator YiaG
MVVGSLIPEARVRPEKARSNSSLPFGPARKATLRLAVDSALATPALFCHDGEPVMARKELLPLIQQLKGWRRAHGFSQYEASRMLRNAGIPVTTDSLQAWEIGRWNPRASVALALALAEFLQRQPKRRHGRRSRERGK